MKTCRNGHPKAGKGKCAACRKGQRDRERERRRERPPMRFYTPTQRNKQRDRDAAQSRARRIEVAQRLGAPPACIQGHSRSNLIPIMGRGRTTGVLRSWHCIACKPTGKPVRVKENP